MLKGSTYLEKPNRREEDKFDSDCEHSPVGSVLADEFRKSDANDVSHWDHAGGNKKIVHSHSRHH